MVTQSHDYPNRILLLVSGGSPAIITETLYAITQKTQPAFIPTEIHIITTSDGYRDIEKNLLGEEGHLTQLYNDYHLIPLKPKIHQIIDCQGSILSDIVTQADNEAYANFVTNIVRELTSRDKARLHVSIAGGRKTMTYYLGYAMSVFGRVQDQMSHVIIDEKYFSTDFYYPTPKPVIMKTRSGEIFDASKVEIKHAQLPYLRLRDGLTEELLNDATQTYSDLINLAQQQLEPISVKINKDQVWCGNVLIQLSAIQIAIYKWLLVKYTTNQAILSFQNKESRQYLAEDFLGVYAEIIGKASGHYEKAKKTLENGMEGAYFTPHRTKINNKIKKELGQSAAKPYLIEAYGSRNKMRYAVSQLLPQDKITFLQNYNVGKIKSKLK